MFACRAIRAILRARRAADEMDRGTCRRAPPFCEIYRELFSVFYASTAFAGVDVQGKGDRYVPQFMQIRSVGRSGSPGPAAPPAPRFRAAATAARRSRGPIRAAAPRAHIERYETHSVPGCRVRSGREGGARREPVECGGSRLGQRAWPRPRTTIFYYSSLYCCKSNLSSLATDSTSASAASHRKRGASM